MGPFRVAFGGFLFLEALLLQQVVLGAIFEPLPRIESLSPETQEFDANGDPLVLIPPPPPEDADVDGPTPPEPIFKPPPILRHGAPPSFRPPPEFFFRFNGNSSVASKIRLSKLGKLDPPEKDTEVFLETSAKPLPPTGVSPFPIEPFSQISLDSTSTTLKIQSTETSETTIEAEQSTTAVTLSTTELTTVAPTSLASRRSRKPRRRTTTTTTPTTTTTNSTAAQPVTTTHDPLITIPLPAELAELEESTTEKTTTPVPSTTIAPESASQSIGTTRRAHRKRGRKRNRVLLRRPVTTNLGIELEVMRRRPVKVNDDVPTVQSELEMEIPPVVVMNISDEKVASEAVPLRFKNITSKAAFLQTKNITFEVPTLQTEVSEPLKSTTEASPPEEQSPRQTEPKTYPRFYSDSHKTKDFDHKTSSLDNK
ncbi:unnamed protein product [Caenorhabditis auriculariae]|uniref:Uncharacterized protein n=1 Tax=Caenorhabditis auriculariae TaxID=2777116 RepID=A0A8S1H3K3_9PELO|nr:unnamed protein product [Caenorhabditis auriculariae]